MPIAFVLINAEIGRIDDVLSELLKIDEVVEAYSVAGPYAILAKIEAEKFEKLTEIIPAKVHSIDGIKGTLTLLAFGVGRELRLEACEKARELARSGAIKELYGLCRSCKQLKLCSYGARVITYGF
ncbi:MAG: Lrp/AsnC ligand binding domain-containing protein [Candidatus Hodarchaeaceae archaeon]|nr:Lrp/AsnC ligand binding domain-containing protein [Candidatus Hodarchaeaceae archaeon]